ncbi:ABC transporter permease [Williamsia deligens]|uniref:ABC transporter permease n=1 Tax=Williamsia deligens TaxID=321325 RepID=A0ABW3G3I0_9NOCA|nr:ABC transporter permease [Williamsia deligens]MCP2194703.1 ABC-2 type transport system permease protein [Williamsia deligens]
MTGAASGPAVVTADGAHDPVARLMGGDTGRPTVHPLNQIGALTGRSLRSMFRQGEFYLGVFAPIMLAICFYVPLRSIFDSIPGVRYGQFLMPVICLQSVGFVATSAAMRAATDASVGITERLRSMPVNPMVPMLARMVANTVLLVVSLVWALLSGLAIGWRPQQGPLYFLGFILVALAIGILLAVGADAIGILANNPEATSQALALPQLILGMLSTGFVPESQFPGWIRPFARNQPISQFTELMRAFDSGSVRADQFVAPGAWALGILVLVFVGFAMVFARGYRK